jgi:uncharacterized DUF497 family protein
MKYFDWSEEKNEQLKIERGLSFEDVIIELNEKRVFEQSPHPNQKKYPNQQIFIIELNRYCYVVPFVEDQEKMFLKTIIPSRKATKKYLINKK